MPAFGDTKIVKFRKTEKYIESLNKRLTAFNF